MLVPSTCKAVTQVLSKVSRALGVQAPAGFWALQVTGLVVAVSVVPPDRSVVAVALAWFVVGNVLALKVLAGPLGSPREFFDFTGFQVTKLYEITWFVTWTFNTFTPPPFGTEAIDMKIKPLHVW